MKIRKICILGLDDYAMLSGDSGYGHVGGESVQHVLLARAWRDMGLDVSIIVNDHGQPRSAMNDGVRSVAAFRPAAGLRGLRFFHPRLTSLARALREVDADAYYLSPASGWAGIAVWLARRWGKLSVVRIASDVDCVRGGQAIKQTRDRRLFEYGLSNANLIAAQTVRQRELLKQHYGLESEIYNVAVEAPHASEASLAKDIDVLWVGNLRPMKRPDLALELARRFPELRFAIVGGSVPEHTEYFSRIEAEARALPNVVMPGLVPYHEVGAWFSRARIHLNTSDIEGFPNTFLQAWVRGVPVASFFDPDQLIQRHDIGVACRDIEHMAIELRRFMDDARRADVGRRAAAFVSREFSPAHIASRYLDALDAAQLSSSRPAARRTSQRSAVQLD